jgi:hypothetical protein
MSPFDVDSFIHARCAEASLLAADVCVYVCMHVCEYIRERESFVS